MKYRRLGRTNVEVSALGFGAMRLPVVAESGAVDEPAAVEMIRCAIDHGVNYVDTAYPYHDGASEVVVGKALRDGYRRKVHLATKLPTWDVKKVEDCDRLLDEQLRRLQSDRVEFYLLHCLNKQRWPEMRDLGVLDWAARAKADGRIGEVGFSFHDTFDAFREIVDGYDWPLCQIQYNLVNEDVQAGTEGLEYAAAKGLAVVIMEPLFGGTLANPPAEIRAIWDAAGRDPVDAALQWLWNQPKVSLVLSGMTTLEHVRRNVASAARSGVAALARDDLDLIARVQAKYGELSPIPCTKCGYCMPCPNGVDIPGNFELYNNAVVFRGSSETLSRNLYRMMPAGERAAACEQCGACEDKCPQGIAIAEELRRVEKEFGESG